MAKLFNWKSRNERVTNPLRFFALLFVISGSFLFVGVGKASAAIGDITATTTLKANAGPTAIAFDGTNMWTANDINDSVNEINPSGIVIATTTLKSNAGPCSITFDGTNMWVANTGTNTVNKINLSGIVIATTTLASGASPSAIAFDGTNMWTANGNDTVNEISPSGSILKTVNLASGASPSAIAFDGTNMWVANYGNNTVNVINSSGVVIATTTLKSNTNPFAIAFDGTNMWVTNTGTNTVNKINLSGIVIATTTLASGASPQGIAFDGVNMWVTNGSNNTVNVINSLGAVIATTTLKSNAAPYGIAFDGTNMWAVNQGNDTVNEIIAENTTGTLLTISTSTTLSFSATQGSTATSSQSVTITNLSLNPNWSAFSTQSWLTFSKASGSLASGVSTTISFIVNPTGLSAGTYTAIASFYGPNSSSNPESVSVSFNILAPPAVTMSSPANGATVLGTATVISATTTSTVGIASVRFYLDSSPLSSPITSTSSPDTYSYSWDTSSITNGSHTLYAFAVDKNNNTASSSPTTITVANHASNEPFYVDTESTASQSLGTVVAPFKTLDDLWNGLIRKGPTIYISGRSTFTGELISTNKGSVDAQGHLISGGESYFSGATVYGDWIPGTVSGRYKDKITGHRAKVFNARVLSGYTWTNEGGGVYSTTLTGTDAEVFYNLITRTLVNVGDSMTPPYTHNGGFEPFSYTSRVDGSGFWIDDGDGMYTPIQLVPYGQTPETNQWAPKNTSGTQIYINIGGASPSTKSILAADAPKDNYGNPSNITTLENWSPDGTTFDGFEVWFGYIGIGNSGCGGGLFRNIDIYYPALMGAANDGGMDVQNVSINYSGSIGYFDEGNTYGGVNDATPYSSNLIIRNSHWIGMYVQDFSYSGYHDTIYNSTIYGSSGDGLFVNDERLASSLGRQHGPGGTPITIKNVVSFNNGGYDFDSTPGIGVDLIVSNNCTSGGSYGGDWSTYKGIGNIERDCNLVSPSAGNFTLQSTSPAIDAGTPVGLTSDYTGNPIYGAPDIGGYEYQPPYTIGTTPIPAPVSGGSIRVYANGQYSTLTATSTKDTIAPTKFSVTPVGGYYTASTSAYLDITINDWSTTGTENKQWTATSTIGVGYTHATSTVYIIGNLLANTAYIFKLDGSPSTALTSSQCTGSVCTSDSSGNITFTYTGGYSTHTFSLQTPPTVTGVSTITASSTNKTPSLSFSSTEAGTLLYAGSCTPSSTNVSSGSNTFTFNTLADGTYSNCAFSVLDSFGNDSATTTLNSFLIDTTGPTGSITNANGTPTNQVTPILNLTIADTGVGITSAQMRFSCDSNTWSTWESYATPKTTFNIDTGAGCTNSDGTKKVYVQYKDSLGNVGSSYNTGSFTLDTVAKNASLSNTPGTYGIYTASTNASISVAGTGVISYEYKLDSGSYSAETLIVSPIVLSSLSEGSHTIYVIGKDAAGNWQSTSAPTTYTWIVDTTAPTLSGNGGGSFFNSSSATVTLISGDSTASIHYTLDGSTPTCSSTLYSSPLTFTNTTTLSAIACDEVNNTSAVLTATYSTFATGQYSANNAQYFSVPAITTETPSSSTSTTTPASPETSQGTAPQTTIYHFTHNLQLNQTSADVKKLQQFLNTHGFIITTIGAGSPGHETTTFGIKTYKALKKYQKSQGLPATGWFGPMTRGSI